MLAHWGRTRLHLPAESRRANRPASASVLRAPGKRTAGHDQHFPGQDQHHNGRAYSAQLTVQDGGGMACRGRREDIVDHELVDRSVPATWSE